MSERAFVKLEVEGAIATLTIDRQDKLNALDRQVIAELADAVREVGSAAGVRALIVTGAGTKAFVAGADIAAMKDMDSAQAREFSRAGHDAFAALEALPFPVIAAVNGFALGGGTELALACDFVYASEKAKFGQPEVKLGVIPGFGGTQRLLRRVGIARARELVYTGAIIGADEALRIGLANRVLPPDELVAAARATAETIAQMGPLAVATAKKVLRDGEGLSLPEGNALEIEGFASGFDTADQREGMEAFLAKRAPAFSGR